MSFHGGLHLMHLSETINILSNNFLIAIDEVSYCTYGYRFITQAYY